MQSGTYTLHVRKSTDSGATWSGDLRTITNATNPALAINKEGRLGFLYQRVDGVRPSQQWQTAIELTFNDFASKKAHVLANTPANTPAKSFGPHLGDYLYMMAVGKRFYGIFCANNTPDHANFPNGVTYQRNTDFATKTLLAVDNITPVGISIDPFFFSVGPGFASIATALASTGNFRDACVGGWVDLLLTINNPFPAILHPGSCMGVVVRYKALERCPVCCELVITSNDPVTPVKTLDVMAYTIWTQCGCASCCDDCRKGGCDKEHQGCRCNQECADDCCQDEED